MRTDSENDGHDPLLPGLQFDGDQLSISSEKIHRILDRPALSPSTAQGMAGCPARWLAEKALSPLVPEDPFAANTLGTGAHSVLEGFYSLPSTERTRLAAARIAGQVARRYAAEHPEQMADAEVRGLWREEVAHRYSGIFEIEDPTQVKVLANERRMDGVEVAGVPFVGLIDRLEEIYARNKTGSRVGDYKAGKAKGPGPDRFGNDDHGDQIRLYAEAVRVADGVLPLEGRLYYVTHRKQVRVPLGRKNMKPTLDRFAAAWSDLRTYARDAAVPLRTSPLCGWCPLVNACPAAKAEGKTDRAGGAPSEVDLGIPTVRAMTSTATTGVDVPSADTPTVLAGDWDDEVAGDEQPPLQTVDAADGDGFFDDPHGAQAPSRSNLAGVTTSETQTDTEEATMTSSAWRENKPWEGETVDGHLSMNSYAATAVFGVAELAVEALAEAGLEVKGSAVTALKSVLAEVVLDAQEEVTGTREWGMGANTRLRGALRTVLATMPLPFGADEDAWAVWQTRATRRAVSIARAALDLYDNGPRRGAVTILGELPTPATGPRSVAS
ncbi:RecB family exonuclease [Isoptericola croceus]|uniref:RecB family exonuclease n=1 Tax=Isoptericola croceus TaxID=3031406 RepID=UPI0023F8BD07|nr:PD-(D/E)XK nuclease family protein [Isoptericola croceus]